MSAYAQSAPGAGGRSEQYSLAKVLGIWATAALPMAALAWIVAPLVADRLDGPLALPRPSRAHNGRPDLAVRAGAAARPP
jgi:hypothetical protein